MAKRCRCKGSLPEFTDRCGRRASTLEQVCTLCRDLGCDSIRILRRNRPLRGASTRPPVRRVVPIP